MDLFFLATQSNYIFPIKQVAWLLGYIMEGIFIVLDKFGIGNIGLSIIAFTIIVNLLMLPMTIKQQKFTKMNAVMAPEIKAIQNKYKGKSGDQNAMLQQNQEIQAVYQKYGTSPTGSCLYLLIQMPIIFGLYQVIYKIPGYVPQIKTEYQAIVDKIITCIGNDTSLFDKFNEFYQSAYAMSSKAPLESIESFVNNNNGVHNHLIDMLYVLPNEKWNELFDMLNGSSFSSLITANMDRIDKMNSFLGVNLSQKPWFYVSNFKTVGILAVVVAILIPVLSALSQFISTKLTTAITNSGKEKSSKSDDPTEQSMKMMNTIMPIFSLVICFTFPCGIGVYWVASSVVRLVIQLIVNAYLGRMDMEDMVRKNVEKANKKREKRGLPLTSQANLAQTIKNLQNTAAAEAAATDSTAAKNKAEERERRLREATEYYKNASKKKGSLASKANMVSQFNEKNEKK